MKTRILFSFLFAVVALTATAQNGTITASHYLADITCTIQTSADESTTTSLYDLVKDLKYGENVRYSNRLVDHPTDFQLTMQPGMEQEYLSSYSYDKSSNKLTIEIFNLFFDVEFMFTVTFPITAGIPKGDPVALKRGLMAIHQSGGNLVSWRARKTDTRNYKFKLFRGDAEGQTTKVNSGKPVVGKTNFFDSGASASAYYRLEVYDDNGQLVDIDVSRKTWNDQLNYITLEGGAPTDPTSANATYIPNDASFCDMDGDGEYDIVLKWAPSNEKDAASSGVTSPAFYACYHLDGKRLWMLHTGPNMFNSAHPTPFVAWDLDGDGFGEFMVKTAPGAVDGQGKYVIMAGDDPTKSWKGSNGTQTSGPEYITVFNGTTGAELKTIKYHTAYADESTTFWGDSKQNRSERYLAAIAWLDGEDKNPSAIFARGYYSGCKIGAYDWDGENLTLR